MMNNFIKQLRKVLSFGDNTTSFNVQLQTGNNDLNKSKDDSISMKIEKERKPRGYVSSYPLH